MRISMRLLNWYWRQVENRLRGFRSEYFNHGFDVDYSKNKNSFLNSLCDIHGSDKGEIESKNQPYSWGSHSYADLYELIFRLRRHDVALVLECGIGTNLPDKPSSMGVNGKPGASLKIWRDYFPNAQIIGIDVDQSILFGEERIKTFACDQTSADDIANVVELADLKDRSVDVIIDDGLHEFHAGITLFENLQKCLSADGIYVIEDVSRQDYMRYKSYFEIAVTQYHATFFSLRRPNARVANNRLVVITSNC